MKTLKNISYVAHTLAHVTLHEKGPSAMSVHAILRSVNCTCKMGGLISLKRVFLICT